MDRRYINGSKIVYLCVTLMDILLANLIYYIIVNCGQITVPERLVGEHLVGVICATVAAVVGVSIYGNIIYRQRISVWEVFLRGFRLTLVQSLVLLALTRIFTEMSQSILRLTACYFVFYYTMLLLLRFLERQLLNKLRRMGHNKKSVVFIGSDPVILFVYNDMQQSAAIAYNIIGLYSNNDIEHCPEGLKRIGTSDGLMQAIRDGKRPFYADMVICSMSTYEQETNINNLVNYCDQHVIQLFLVPHMFTMGVQFSPVQMGDFTVFTNHKNNINRIDNRIIKRLFDIAFSFIVCIFLIPLIPVIWIIVKLQSPGPLFFCQKRTGLNGETFNLYKFRSMHVNDDADVVQATKNDPRKFAFGEFMRKTNIDELPQFFNVLIGDMSIVGPRPHMLYHTQMYSTVISKYMVRHFSKPGITGWAQVTGYRGETKELWQMEERVKRDIWYNENWSFTLDMEIIFRTIVQIFHPNENAY